MRTSFLSIAMLAVWSICGNCCLAQQDATPIHVESTAPADSRYEIVQSTLVARLTFKLDKQTGHVSQLVHDSGGDETWELMPVVGLPAVSSPGCHYQLFLSGLAVRFAFLVNTDSGRVWQLQKATDPTTKEETEGWVPIGG